MTDEAAAQHLNDYENMQKLLLKEEADNIQRDLELVASAAAETQKAIAVNKEKLKKHGDKLTAEITKRRPFKSISEAQELKLSTEAKAEKVAKAARLAAAMAEGAAQQVPSTADRSSGEPGGPPGEGDNPSDAELQRRTAALSAQEDRYNS